MPKMELIIKKIFGKVFSGVDAVMSGRVVKSLLFIYDIYEAKQLNKKIKFFYYYKGDQTLPNIFPNVSVYDSFIKRIKLSENNNFCCGVLKYVVVFLLIELIDAFGEVWSFL